MNQKSLTKLEYNKIIELLTEQASSFGGQSRCRRLKPMTDIVAITKAQEETAASFTRIVKKGRPSFGSVHPVSDSLKRLEIGGTLGSGELLRICKVLENTAQVKSYGRHENADDAEDCLDPLFSQLEPLTTRIMIGNRNNRFVIGGIEKLDVVRGQGGIPILKDIPLIGWAFSTESESTKKSQLVVVAECESVRPDSALPENINSDIQVIRDATKDAGNSNSYGYGQWGFDSGKKLDLDTY